MAHVSQPAPSDTLHDIHFGSSFLTSSAVAGASPPQDALFSLKYAQKPASLDATAPGRLWADNGSSPTIYAAFPSTVSGAATGGKSVEHRFAGKVEPAKEVDCVLIWDEDLQSFSLERLEGSLRLAVDREGHGGPTPSLSASLPAPRPPAPSSLPKATPSSTRPSQEADVASSDSSDSDSEIRVPSVPPAHLRKLASDRARQSLMTKNAAAGTGETSTSESGREDGRGRSRPSAGMAKKQEPEIEDFGDISFGDGGVGKISATAAAAPKPPPAAPQPAPLSLPTSRTSAPTARPAAPKPPPPSAPAPAPVQPALSLPVKSSPPRPTPQPPHPAPPSANTSTSVAPPRPFPAPQAAVASKRPPSSARASKAPSKSRPSMASKIPASSGAPPSPKKSKRRSSVAQKSVALSKATVSSSEGSSDGASSDESSGSGSEEEDTGIPEGYLARPGSMFSASAGGSAAPRPPARKAPMKASVAVVSDSASASGSGSDSDESDDMEILASSINSSLSGPAVGPGRVQGQVGKGKGGAKRAAVASKIPASANMGARAGYASKVPASTRSSIASKIPASSTAKGADARAQKGPARASGYDVDAARQREREADVPDSESEED